MMARTSSFSSSYMLHGARVKTGSRDGVGFDAASPLPDDFGIRQFASQHPLKIFAATSALTTILDAMAGGEYLVAVDGGLAEEGGLKGKPPL